MFYENSKSYAPDKFKRLTGVSKDTFATMTGAPITRFRAFGRPPAFCLEDRLLLVLMCWREYRTYEHTGETYGVSEATVCRTVKAIETSASKTRAFPGPERKPCAKATPFSRSF